jgi:hypothetical protein
MKKITLAVSLITVLSTTAMAQQTGQSQQTVRPGISGNSATINGSGGMTSSSGGMTSSGMRDSTAGISTSRPERDVEAALPKATAMPKSQPSNNETPTPPK